MTLRVFLQVRVKDTNPTRHAVICYIYNVQFYWTWNHSWTWFRSVCHQCYMGQQLLSFTKQACTVYILVITKKSWSTTTSRSALPQCPRTSDIKSMKNGKVTTNNPKNTPFQYERIGAINDDLEWQEISWSRQSHKMLQHLGMRAKDKLLDIFNNSWKTGHVPQIWREKLTWCPSTRKAKTEQRLIDRLIDCFKFKSS